jgi:phosphatidylglycerophosphate synthase
MHTTQPADGTPPEMKPADGAAPATQLADGTPPEMKPAEGAAPATRLAVKKEARPAILRAAVLGLVGTAVLLGIVSATAGLGVAGWIVGLAVGSAAAGVLAAARARSDEPSVHPADWVTLTRMLLIAGVAGLVADSFSRPVSVTALVTLSTVALVLDAVDGQVARRTGTATALGGRIDGEVDAFLILLLSIFVSQKYGSWVLAIGAIRYALLLAGWLMPWLAAPLPPRYWRKVVAAVQGIVLTVAASGLLDKLAGQIAVAAAGLLLLESFGHDIIWLYREGAGRKTRQTLRVTVTVLAAVLLWIDLLAPDKVWQLTPSVFLRIPVEALVLVAIGLVLPTLPRRILAGVIGFLLGVLTIAKILNMAFFDTIDSAFNPVDDWSSIPSALGVIRDTIGTVLTDIALGALCLGLILLVAALTASAIHVTTVTARHRRGALRGLAAFTAAWGIFAGLSLQVVPGFPLASTTSAALAVSQVRATQSAITDSARFKAQTHAADPEAKIPAANLLTGLRGKDVIIDFVESYGQVAIRGTSFSPGIDATLRQNNAALNRAGFSAQSAWAVSPSFGGVSQLSHSTLQSGLWVNSNQRYSQLLASKRFTLTDAFDKVGVHTVLDDPENSAAGFPAGKTFFHYDTLFNRGNVGYHGPSFSYSAMPDQYVYSQFQRNELAPGHKPVFAEIDTTSSHTPWAPLPTMVPWNKVGNGSIFDKQPAESESATTVWRNSNTVRRYFRKSIQYSLRTLTSWVTQLHDPNLVLVILGDEQPHTIISGIGATHEVPITIIAHDPKVFRQIASWHWQDGLIPNNSAPIERMSVFRNQFLNTFSTSSVQTTSAHGSAAPSRSR